MSEPKWEVLIEPVRGYGYTWLLIRDGDVYAESVDWCSTEQEAIEDAQPMVKAFGASLRIVKSKATPPPPAGKQ